MTPQELKNSILQLAIQGRLVEQRPEEGTAEELYKKIQAEKQSLIKAGKLKKEKPLPPITDDEKPFVIPESWMWVRITNIWSILNGDRGKNYPAKSTLSHEGIPFISALNLDGRTVIKDDNLLCLSDQQYDKLGNGKLIQGDIVVCIRGSLGKHGIYPFEKGAIASSLVIMRQQLNLPILDEFLLLYLDTPLFFLEIKRYDNGTAQPNLAANSLEQFLFPLPSLAEQKRIVAKIEELLPLIDRYEKAWSRLEDFNKRFPDDMQKSILQMAIQGKLVEQRPEEGTAEELYKQIQKELLPLIKLKKFKGKHFSDLSESELPFEIPESWKWVRLGDIISIESGKNLTSSQMEKGTVPVYGGNGITGYHNEGLVHKETIVIGRVGFYCGSVHVTEQEAWITDNAFITTYPENSINRDYLVYVLRQMNLGKDNNATAQPVVSGKKIYPLAFPLPPLAEQKRIVAKIEELLPLCERLK